MRGNRRHLRTTNNAVSFLLIWEGFGIVARWHCGDGLSGRFEKPYAPWEEGNRLMPSTAMFHRHMGFLHHVLERVLKYLRLHFEGVVGTDGGFWELAGLAGLGPILEVFVSQSFTGSGALPRIKGHQLAQQTQGILTCLQNLWPPIDAAPFI